LFSFSICVPQFRIRFFKIIPALLVSGLVIGCISSQQIMTEKAQGIPDSGKGIPKPES
jgi:hypothetical protein